MVLLAAANRLLVFCERANLCAREICGHHGARAANRVFPMGDDYVYVCACARAPTDERAKNASRVKIV